MILVFENKYLTNEREDAGVVKLSKQVNHKLDIEVPTEEKLQVVGFNNVDLFQDSFTTTTEIGGRELTSPGEFIEYFFTLDENFAPQSLPLT